MSVREIKNKIYQKGIYADQIEEYIDENKEMLQEYELNSAKKLVQKKQGTDQKKLRAYLANKGYDEETLCKILNND